MRFSRNRVLRSNNEIFPEKLSVFAKPFVLCTVSVYCKKTVRMKGCDTLEEDDYYSGDAWGESVYFDIDMLFSITFCGEEYIFSEAELTLHKNVL